MTISATTNRISYNGNGSTTAFAFSYPFHAQADLVVISTVIATGVQTVKALTTDYTISGTTDSLGHYSSGGTVNFITAPASTVRITIYRDPARTQSLNLTENDNLPAESVESKFDYVTMLIQRVADLIGRTPRQPEGDSADIDRLPSKVDRASKYFGFDSDGDPVALAAPTDTTLVSSFAETLLDDTSAAVARATLDAEQKLSTTGQLAFPATQIPSAEANTLDDYEEGVWTPSVGGDATYTLQQGTYVKVGKMVTVWGSMTINALGTGSTDEITGLPFPVKNVPNYSAICPVYYSAVAVNVVTLVGLADAGASRVTMYGTSSAAGDTMSALAVFGDGAAVVFTLSYEAEN